MQVYASAAAGQQNNAASAWLLGPYLYTAPKTTTHIETSADAAVSQSE